MEQAVFKQKLFSLVKVDALNYWEVEEYIEQLAGLPEEAQRAVLRQVAVIWPVSHALCFAFLDQVQAGLACLHHTQLPEWVNAILDVYERDGLQQARRFMAEVESTFLCRIRGETGLALGEATGRLLPYLRGLSGHGIEVAAAAEVSTDGQTIFLPPEITLFKEKEKNFLVYKLIASFQWGLLAGDTFRTQLDPEQSLIKMLTTRYGRRLDQKEPFPADFWVLFPEPKLASDLFALLETYRIFCWLKIELPGLMHDSGPVFDRLHRRRRDLTLLAGRPLLLEAIGQWILARRTKGRLPRREQQLFAHVLSLIEPLSRLDGTVGGTLPITAELYRLLEPLSGLAATEPLAVCGRLRPMAVAEARRQRREEVRQQFIKALAAVLPPDLSGDQPPEQEAAVGPPARLPTGEGAVMLLSAEAGETEELDTGVRAPEYLVIGNQELRIPEPLRPLANEIRQDFGRIPDRYISAALGQAGKAPIGGSGPPPVEGEAAAGPLVYDEWDYRRAGFRKDWCVLQEKELLPVRGTFVPHTLEKYRGQLRQLRRQFEMMRLQQRFLKQQKDGDDIDLEAVTEALTDSRAGRSPSEKLFIRLARDERDIAAVFLVDMSSSTEGWVSTALKEALVLMCESMEVLGDRYAIYGFSGMRRLRSELYHLKHLGERYDEEVKGRIAAISPREYTRMGPPIRHLTEMLEATDARIRLLITLSDGKPEDYDDYKGKYAIEDTRHALIEAKAAGIHPFCITIDQEAHDYIPHMYGEVNYIFIDEVKKLPLRMPEIYRSLTT
jgi:nitric oxide reductase NorD protein